MMKLVILALGVVIIGMLMYRLWKPYTSPPKTEVPAGQANLYFFYTDWCGFSQKAMPEWEKLEESLQKKSYYGNTKVTPIRVDADKDKKKATLYNIDAYPTILLETKNGIYDFTKVPKDESIRNFLRETLGKESSSL